MQPAPLDLFTPPAQPNQSLADGITVLLQLVSARQPVGSRELARELGFEPTRVNRLLGTLASLGMAARTADRKYTAGAGVHLMAALSLGGSRLLPLALPHLDALQARTGLGVALGVLWRRHVCYLIHAAAGRQVAEGIAGHHLYAAEQSSIGMALLAELPPEELARIYPPGGDWPVDRTGLQRRLEFARRVGYADNEDRSIAVAIGVPGTRPVAAVAVIGLSAPPTDVILAALRAAASAIALRLAD